MKQIIKLSLILIVTQVICSQALPTSTPSQEIVTPVEDKEIYNFHPKAKEFAKKLLLIDLSVHIKEFELFIEFLETQEQSASEKDEARQALTKYVESLKEKLQYIKEHQVTCSVSQYLRKLSEEEKYSTRIFFNMDDEQKSRIKKLFKDKRAQGKIVINKLNELLPEITEKFLARLSGDEKEKYEVELVQNPDKYSVFLSYYGNKLGIDKDAVFDDDTCESFENKMFIEFLKQCSKISKHDPFLS